MAQPEFEYEETWGSSMVYLKTMKESKNRYAKEKAV